MALSPNTKKLIVRIVFFLVYLLVGAAIFHAIELPHEKEQRARLQFQKVKDNFTKTYNISDEDIKCFLKKLKTALKLGFDLQEADYHEIEQWHFMNAFVFAGNVVTTIGEFESHSTRKDCLVKVKLKFCHFIDIRIITRLWVLCPSNKRSIAVYKLFSQAKSWH